MEVFQLKIFNNWNLESGITLPPRRYNSRIRRNTSKKQQQRTRFCFVFNFFSDVSIPEEILRDLG